MMRGGDRFVVVFSLLGLLFATSAQGQGAYVYYGLSSGLSTTECNVFSTPKTIGGLAHRFLVGGVRYVAPSKLALPVAYGGKGVAYQIDYPFKKNHAYEVLITAASDSSATLMMSVGPSLAGGSAACGTSPDAQIFGGPFTSFVTLDGFFGDRTMSFTPTDDSLGALRVAAYGGSSVDGVVHIKSVRIVETPPVYFSPDFRIAKVDCSADVFWGTKMEPYNARAFKIWRSFDAANWIQVAEQPATPGSGSARLYQFRDNAPYNPNLKYVYYYVQLVDSSDNVVGLTRVGSVLMGACPGTRGDLCGPAQPAPYLVPPIYPLEQRALTLPDIAPQTTVWGVTSELVARVSPPGIVTGVAPGRVYVHAFLPACSKNYTWDVTVLP